MSLSLKVKFFNFLRVVHSLGVNLFVSNDDTFPNSFIGFLEVELKEFAIFDTPERIFNFNLFTEFTLKEGFFALKPTSDMLGLNFDIELISFGPFWKRNLNLYIEYTL